MSSAQERVKTIAQKVMQAAAKSKEAETRSATLREELARVKLQIEALQSKAAKLADQAESTQKVAEAEEAVVIALGDEMSAALEAARVEQEAETQAYAKANAIKEYPSGRYECARCGHSTLFTEVTRELPMCDNCGAQEYVGHDTIIELAPPPPSKYQAGMYQCKGCGARIAVAVATDEPPECDFCHDVQLAPLV